MTREQTMGSNQNRIKGLMLAFALMAAGTVQAADKSPDAAGYRATDQVTASFSEIVGQGGSASVLEGADDAVAALTLPFPFNFYGTNYTVVCVSSNGIMTFVPDAASCVAQADMANIDLSSDTDKTPGDTPAIAPYWMDLSFQSPGAAVYYQKQGVPGSQRFIIEWSNAIPFGATNGVTFEVILFEGLNKIQFQYKNVDPKADPLLLGGQSTIGIRDTSLHGVNRKVPWSYNAAVLAFGSAIEFIAPATAQTSVNTITTNPPGLMVMIDGVSYTTPKVVSWTQGETHSLAVQPVQTGGGTNTIFSAWSTGANTASTSVVAALPGSVISANFSVQYQLTTGVYPIGSGAVTGAGWYAAGTPVPVQANAATNYAFAYFSGSLSGAVNPQSVTMDGAKNVVANFRSSANPVLAATVTGKVNAATAGQRTWTIRLTNSGLGTANSAQITGVTFTQTAGAACSPAVTVVSAMPVAVGTIAPATNLTAPFTFDASGCTDSAARFVVRVAFSANGGAYTGSTQMSNQTK